MTERQLAYLALARLEDPIGVGHRRVADADARKAQQTWRLASATFIAHHQMALESRRDA